MKKGLILTVALVLLVVLVITIFIIIPKNNESNVIYLGQKTRIHSLEKIKIKGTNDTFEVTQKVKWKIPEVAEEGATVSFAIRIPYTFTVNGKKYKGSYELNDSSWSKPDKNPKYKLQVTDLTKDGIIEVLISKK